jgi:hypothetical protein
MKSALLALGLLVVSHGSEARFLEEQARKAYEAEDFELALELFSELIIIAPDPVNAFNAAVAAQLAGDRRFAFSLFERYLAMEGPKDAQRLGIATQRRDELARDLALVDVTSTPEGARILVDGSDLGRFQRTPATVALSERAHEIRLVLEGYEEARAEVEAKVGERREVDRTLVPRLGWFKAEIRNAEVAEVEVSRDGDTRTIPAGVPVQLEAGRYTITVDAPGFEVRRADVVVPPESEGGQRNIEVRVLTLEPQPPVTGRILVTTGDVPAELWIDGRLRSQTPAALDVPVGVHELEVRLNGATVWSERTLVIEDLNRLFRVDVQPETQRLPAP